MSVHTLLVDGMTCGHCVETVSKAVGELPGVQSVSVNLDTREVTVDLKEGETSLESISAKISEVGFEVVTS
jgi:copper chaperone